MDNEELLSRRSISINWLLQLVH